MITFKDDAPVKNILSGMIYEATNINNFPPLDVQEQALNQYIKDNPKVVSSKLSDLLINSAHANEGKPMTEEQRKGTVREFINYIGGGVISGEKYVGDGLRNNLPNIMYTVDKSL